MKYIYITQSKLFTIKNKTNNNKYLICQLHSMQLHKEVKSINCTHSSGTILR